GVGGGERVGGGSVDRVKLIAHGSPRTRNSKRVEQTVNEVLTDDKSERNSFVVAMARRALHRVVVLVEQIENIEKDVMPPGPDGCDPQDRCASGRRRLARETSWWEGGDPSRRKCSRSRPRGIAHRERRRASALQVARPKTSGSALRPLHLLSRKFSSSKREALAECDRWWLRTPRPRSLEGKCERGDLNPYGCLNLLRFFGRLAPRKPLRPPRFVPGGDTASRLRCYQRTCRRPRS